MSKEFIKADSFARVDRYSEANNIFAPLSQEQQDELTQLYAGIFDRFVPGKLITGTVAHIDQSGILVNIDYKSDGLVPIYEFSQRELEKFKIGDEITVILDELENQQGNVILSYEKAKAMQAWTDITTLYEQDKPVEGLVTHKVKGGLNVDIGIPAFLPGSQIDLQRVSDFDQYVGQTIIANIIKLNKKRGNVIISRRKFLSEQRTESRKKALDTLSEGQIIHGVVKNITNYGVFIDIGGVDGLLHITDMTWGRISHPNELVKLGDKITVKILSFDKNNEKISLGLKQLEENPWQKIAQKYQVGNKIKGTISSITDYGLFVEIAKGVEGLVHISEISWINRITDLANKFRVGQEIEVLVVSLDVENRRMSLSIKQLEKNPWASVAEQFQVGQKIKGTISNITDFGIFVQLLPGIDGLVHISDLSWTEHIEHPADRYKKGEEVEAIILAIDTDNKKVSLGIKQLVSDPWELIEQKYPIGKLIQGEVSKITNFGAFVKLSTGIEGLIHISELSQERNIEKVEDVLSVGQIVEARVINANKEERKLGLSLNLTENKKEKAPKHAKVEKSTKAMPINVKPKSLLQMELEKHAARQDSINNEE
jgi:small subunit ribosomal protein S1